MSSPPRSGRFQLLAAGAVGSLATMVAAVGIMATAGVGFADGDAITACVKPSGVLRIVDSAASCGPSEAVLTWDQQATPAPAFTQRTQHGVIDPGQWQSVESYCEPGEMVSGGGYSLGSIGLDDKVNVDGPLSVDGRTGWIVSVHNTTAFPIDLSVTAICA